MNKTIKKCTLFIFLFVSIILLSSTSQASGGLNLKKLVYEVQLNIDGTANVTEAWNISIEDTNTLFKTFEVDNSKYKEIKNVQVGEFKESQIIWFNKINKYKYHVDKNCYYALMNDGKFEIAWGAHAEDTVKTYIITYTIVDAVKNYKDCSEFYWQFISTDSGIPAEIVEGTINLPFAVQNTEDLKAWAHGPLNGNIEIESKSTVKFKVEQLNEKTMVETRIITPTNIFYLNNNKSNMEKLNSILTEEKKWADEANAERERIANYIETRDKVIKIIFFTTNIIGLLLTIKLISKIKAYRKKLNETELVKPDQIIEYYRDIPNENATPAEATFLLEYSGFQNKIPKIISATMLDLAMKKYIEFEVLPDKKEKIKVVLKKEDTKELPIDEKIIYELMKKVGFNDTKSFTMKDFDAYIKKNSSSIMKQFLKIEDAVKENQEKEGNYSKELIEEADKWSLKAVGYTFLTMISLIFMWILVIPSIVAIVYCIKISQRYRRLTKKGINEQEKWNGLKTYMEHFSMIDEITVPELILWEKYLVYATAFGIADEVLKQLKVIYPEIENMDYTSGYSYMPLMYNNGLNESFITTLNDSITSSYNYSSGSGSGGGFSSGGGGRWWWWSEWVEDRRYPIKCHKRLKILIS